MPKRRITFADPVLPTEWPWHEQDDPIWPCRECLPWHVDIRVDEDTQQVWVRQWHAVDCPVLAEIDDETDPERDEN